MDKDAYWFRHDSNSRADTKMVKLRRKSGLEGVGLFWCVVEMLRESTNYELELSSCEDIAYDLRTSEEVFESLFDCGLLVKNGDVFYSESLKTRMVQMDIVREKRKKAGAKGGKNKAKAMKNKANAKQMLASAKELPKQNESNALANPSDKSIVDKSIVDKSTTQHPTNYKEEKVAVAVQYWDSTFGVKTSVDQSLIRSVTNVFLNHGYSIADLKGIIDKYRKYVSDDRYWVTMKMTMFEFVNSSLMTKIFHATDESMLKVEKKDSAQREEQF